MSNEVYVTYREVRPEGLMVLDTKEQMATVVDILLANRYSVIVSAECDKYRLDYSWIGDGESGVTPMFAEEDWAGGED